MNDFSEQSMNERLNGPELIELIYKRQIAKQIAHGAKTAANPNLYKKPWDTQSFRLAVEYCSHWLQKHKMDLTLETAIFESNKMFTTEKHQESYIQRVLRLEPDVPVIPQLINTALGIKDENEKRYQKNLAQLKLEADRDLIQSTDESQFSIQSMAEEAAQLRDMQLQKTKTRDLKLSPQRSDHHKKHRSTSSKSKKKESKAQLYESDTFTEDSEEGKPKPRLWDANYGLDSEKKEQLKAKIERKERRKQKKEMKSRQLEAPIQAAPSEKDQSYSNKPKNSVFTYSNRNKDNSTYSEYSGSYTAYSESYTPSPSAKTGVEVMKLPRPPANIDAAADDESYDSYGSYSTYGTYISYTDNGYSYSTYSSTGIVFVERESPLKKRLPPDTDFSGRRTVIHPPGSDYSNSSMPLPKGSRLVMPPEPERAPDGESDFLAKYNVNAVKDPEDENAEPFKSYEKPANPTAKPSSHHSEFFTGKSEKHSGSSQKQKSSKSSTSSRHSKKSNPGIILQEENVVAEQDVYE